ncbi:hypothetical protein EYF80_052709 [Liparis tanakae]|uniref:Uncharacterized protein n=1 Tax=Liparis tanakae TaxID=230148 RepID=A0A4Z2F8J9_9TELE|nr:hypothetical protein EYF80_052709 [Liparis tanakae]
MRRKESEVRSAEEKENSWERSDGRREERKKGKEADMEMKNRPVHCGALTAAVETKTESERETLGNSLPQGAGTVLCELLLVLAPPVGGKRRCFCPPGDALVSLKSGLFITTNNNSISPGLGQSRRPYPLQALGQSASALLQPDVTMANDARRWHE